LLLGRCERIRSGRARIPSLNSQDEHESPSLRIAAGSIQIGSPKGASNRAGESLRSADTCAASISELRIRAATKFSMIAKQSVSSEPSNLTGRSAEENDICIKEIFASTRTTCSVFAHETSLTKCARGEQCNQSALSPSDK